MKKINKGFTLIELLVVVAIIGILVTIVLAALGSARMNSKDAAVQSQLSSMRSEVALVYGENYTTLCTDTGSVYDKFEAGITNSGGNIADCSATANEYRIVATLPSSLTKTNTITETAYAAGEDGFCINSFKNKERVHVIDFAGKTPRLFPFCSDGEMNNARDYFWGCWFGNALCMMTALPGETLASPPSAPVEYCDPKDIPVCTPQL